MNVVRPALVVDPIFRGSRVMYSAYAADALAREGAAVTVLTRAEPLTDHYRELFAAIPHDLQARVPLAPAIWYAKLSLSLIRNCLRNITALHQARGFGLVLFSGWNEFFPKLALAGPQELRTLREIPSFAIDYSPFFWLRRNKASAWARLQDAAKRLLTVRVLKQLPNLRFLVLDERLFDEELSLLPEVLRDRYLLLPEAAPWSGNVPQTTPNPVKELLVVGLQTRRKGLADIVAALEHRDFPANVRIRLIGRLGDDLKHLRPALERQPSQRLVWEEAFLSEEDIRKCYARCDFLLIPYTRQFNSTSSVLAWACAHGKPVVATDHGLVGYRVSQHGLGVVYPAGETGDLLKHLKRLPEAQSAGYQKIARAGRYFAERSSVEIFKDTLCKHLRSALNVSLIR